MNLKTVSTAAVILAGTILIGVLHGRLTHRWGQAADLVQRGKALRSLPETIGPWELQEDDELNEVSVRVLQCSGYVNRLYRNPDTGQLVRMVIVAGPAGPISVHTPELCFSAREYSQSSLRTPTVVTSRNKKRSGEFWSLNFKANDVHETPLRVFYAWSQGEAWRAAESPRYDFAGSPFLYKIQLAATLESPDETVEPFDPCHQFLRDFLDSAWPLALE